MDMFRHTSPGDPMNGDPAEWRNLLTEVAKDYLARKSVGQQGPAKGFGEVGLAIKNVSGAVRAQYSVVGIGTEVRSPTGSDTSFFGHAAYESSSPASGSPFAILQQPSRINAYAPALIAGFSYVKVNVTDASHGYAAVSAGDYTRLVSQATVGPAEIIKKESGTGEKWALVRFGYSAPGDGRNAGVKYTYSTNTGATDPGSGTLKFNNGTLSAATALYISETDGDSNGLAAWLATWDDSTSTIRGHLYMRKDSNPSVFAIFSLSGTITDNGTWDTFTVAYVAGNGSFSNSDVVKIHFFVKGDKGDTGTSGAAGAAGATGATGGATLIFSKTSVAAGDTVANTTTEGSFAQATLDGNTLVVGDVLRVIAGGVLSSTGTPTLRIRVYWGSSAGTLLLDSGTITLSTVTNQGWYLEADLTVCTIGASGSIEANGALDLPIDTADGPNVDLANTAAITVDTTNAAQKITITATWDTADAGNSITMRSHYVEKISTSGNSMDIANLTSSTFAFDDEIPFRDVSVPGNRKGTVSDLLKLSLGFTLLNGHLVWSVAANALTVAIKNAAGNDPSSSDPVHVVFRSSTATTGSATLRTITAATSFTLSSGSNMGATNSIAFRLWCVLFDDGGTLRLGLVNCALINSTSARDTYNVRQLSNDVLEDSTAEGGAGGADTAQVIYTGTAVTDKPMIILGYADWNSGLATVGTWGTAPSKVQPYHAGVPLPGQMLTRSATFLTTVSTGTTTVPADDTIPQNTEGDEYLTLALVPVSVCNVCRVTCKTQVASSTTGGMSLAIHQDSIANALRSKLITIGASGSIFAMDVDTRLIKPQTTQGSTTTFKMRAGLNNAGTTTINGAGGARFHGGSMVTTLEYEEIMA